MTKSTLVFAALIPLAALAAACTEPRRVEQTGPSPAALEARLELSDSLPPAGSVVRVTIRLVGPSVASATARLAYDSTGLQFVEEETLDDGATRVINPAAGLVRIAAIAPQGFAAGRLHSLRFLVRRPAALQAMKLVMDETHTVARDAVPALSRNP